MKKETYFIGVLNGMKAVLNTMWKHNHSKDAYNLEKCLEKIDELVKRSYDEITHLKEHLMHPNTNDDIESYFYGKFMGIFTWKDPKKELPDAEQFCFAKDINFLDSNDDDDSFWYVRYSKLLNCFIVPTPLFDGKLYELLNKYHQYSRFPLEEIEKLNEVAFKIDVLEWLPAPKFRLKKELK